MHEALRGLTVRGRCFLAAGVACVGCGVLFGQRDLLRIGLFLAALPFVSAAIVQRTRYRLSCQRLVEPARVEAGRQGRVLLRLQNMSRLPTGVLLVEDTLPYTLGARPRFVLHRVEPHGTRDVAYHLRSDVRGRYPIGPLTVRLTDPFGLCELVRSFTSADTLVVTPTVWALPAGRVAKGNGGRGDSHSRSIAASGDDDVATRQYRRGDDLRRIHWRSTARTGELMVRREEQPWQSSAVLVLDNRANAHHGDGPGSSFEYACSAVASIGVHLLANGYVVHPGPGIVDPGLAGTVITANRALLLDQLAVATVARTSLVAGADTPVPADGLVVAVLGAMSPDDATRLTRAGSVAPGSIAVLIDTASWTTLAPRVQATMAAQLDAAAAVLTTAGWRVLRVRHGDAFPQLWQQLVGAGSSAPRWPAAAPRSAPDSEVLHEPA